VALYPATSEADTVSFNLINPETKNRIKMKTVDEGTGEEVSRSDLVKGFAHRQEPVCATRQGRLHWDTPYHLVPSGKTGIEAFAVIREAMETKRMIAIGRLVMSTRERICALEPGRD